MVNKAKPRYLPVAYHHMVFTLPHEFNALVKAHPKVVYQCLFHSEIGTLNLGRGMSFSLYIRFPPQGTHRAVSEILAHGVNSNFQWFRRA